ncbi:MAG TPA: LCP family protein [Herpetosiphonaceae bacterium]|nr:LCP family protein [Herpetosiphonaceae bacterium]
MECHEARRLLAEGVRPGPRPPERARLGFHLAQCAACHAILDALTPADDTLLLTLLAQTAPASAPPASPPARQRSWLVALLALVLLMAGGGAVWFAWQGPAAASVAPPAAPAASADAAPTATVQPAGMADLVPLEDEAPLGATEPSASPAPATPTPGPPAPPTAVPPTPTRGSPSPTPAPSAVPTPAPLAQPVTILLLGLDRRPGESEISRSDAMLLLHIDPLSNTAALLSFARDLWVPLGGNGPHVKINAGYSSGESEGGPQGGAERARDTVAALVNQPIDHVVVITFEGMIKTVDALGGVEIDVETEIYDAEYPTFDYGYMVAHFLPGRQTMDGFTALVYSRTRHADSDFARGRRQQQVILGIAEKLRERLKDGDMIANMALINELYGYLEYTDLPLAEAARYGRQLSAIDPGSVARDAVDLDYGYATSTLDGAYIIEPDIPAIQQLAADLFAAGK